MQEQFRYDDITGKIIGCAMRVHAKLGNGFQEVIYQRALEIEMALEGIKFEREKEMPIYYREILIGTRRVDFFVEELVMVELKAIIELEAVHLTQGINYLEAYNVEMSLLINFGSKSKQLSVLLTRNTNPKKSITPKSLKFNKSRF